MARVVNEIKEEVKVQKQTEAAGLEWK